jgi:hypothetical protein
LIHFAAVVIHEKIVLISAYKRDERFTARKTHAKSVNKKWLETLASSHFQSYFIHK